jgi:uroporphyrinogen-III decarboxylase
MTGKEKLRAALSPDGAREIPAVLCYSGIYFRDHWAQLTPQPWWAASTADMAMHRAMHADLIRNVGQDWYPLPTGPTREDRRDVAIEERADGLYRVNRRTGAERRLLKPQISGWQGLSNHGQEPDNPPRTPADIDARLKIPTAEEINATFTTGATDLTETLKKNEARDLFWLGSTSTPFWNAWSLWSFDEMMRKPLEDPKLLRHMCARAVETKRPHLRRLARMGVEGVWIEECMTDMLSPALFREFNLPYLRAITDAIRAEGMCSIYYYCGNPNDRLDALLESGADALSLEESKKGWEIDIEKIAAAVDGRMALLGNLDAIGLLEHAPERDLRAGITRQIKAGRRNRSRFIMSLGSPVTPGTGVDRVRRYCELAHEIGGRG